MQILLSVLTPGVVLTRKFKLRSHLHIVYQVTDSAITLACHTVSGRRNLRCKAMERLRRQHLLAGAELLLGSSPSTSAFLATQCGQLIPDQNSEHAARSHESGFCQSCGTIQIPGVTVRTSRVVPQGRTLNVRTAVRGNVSKQRRCRVCRRYLPMKSAHQKTKLGAFNIQAIPQLATIKTAPAASPAPVMQTSDTSQATASKPLQEGKASSKQRAKARKDRAGLQALLGKSTTAPLRPGLSFADFLKK
jgi:hypothetical protein